MGPAARRRTLAAGGLALAGGLAWLALGRDGGRREEPARAGESAPARTIAEPVASPGPGVEPLTEVAEGGAARRERLAPPRESERPVLEVSGTVVLIAGGARNERPSGEVELYVWREDAEEWEGASGDVVDGAWSLELACDADDLSGWTPTFELEGKPTHPLRWSDGEVVPGPHNHIEVFAEGDILLHLVDAESGLDLPEAEVWIPRGVRGAKESDGDRPREGEREDFHLVSGGSPLVLAPDLFDGYGADGSLRIHARAPGYGWRSATLSILESGERWLTLRRGGTLAVEFAGPWPDVEGVRLSDPSGWPSRGTALRGDEGRAVLEDVAEGRYRLSFLGRGLLPEAREVTVVAGMTVVEVVADEATTLADAVRITGSLSFGDGWIRDDHVADLGYSGYLGYTGYFTSVDELSILVRHGAGSVAVQPVPDGSGAWTFEARVVPGPCRFEVEAASYAERRDVAEGDLVELFVPALVPVSVRGVLPGGERAPLEAVWWRSDSFAASVSGGPDAEEPLVLTVPVGPVTLGVLDDRFRCDPFEVEVLGAGQEVLVPVTRAQTAELVFLDGGSPVLFDACAGDELLGSSTAPLDRCVWEGAVLRVELARPGPATLSFANAAAGFLPVPDVRVDVPEGEVRRYEVRLARRGPSGR